MAGEPVSAAEITDGMAETLEAAGVHRAYVFAFRQCGFLLTEENVHLFDDEDVAEWECALDRWIEMHPDAEPL
jgi:glycosyltransferase involved in cell wall biosynthesis